MDKICESGLIGQDGKLRLPMDRLNAFFAANKGKRLVATFYADAPGSSKLQQAYYYNYVVPTISAALYEQGTRKSDAGIDLWLVEQYPGDKTEQNLGSGMLVYEARYFSKTQMTDFLEWLKQFAAENLYVYIEDPKAL